MLRLIAKQEEISELVRSNECKPVQRKYCIWKYNQAVVARLVAFKLCSTTFTAEDLLDYMVCTSQNCKPAEFGKALSISQLKAHLRRGAAFILFIVWP